MSAPVSNARLAAELQAASLAITMFGLDAINSGRVTLRDGGSRYRGYIVEPSDYSPAPAFDWSFRHEDYDGAPDANDQRFGYGGCPLSCMSQIDDLEDDA